MHMVDVRSHLELHNYLFGSSKFNCLEVFLLDLLSSLLCPSYFFSSSLFTVFPAAVAARSVSFLKKLVIFEDESNHSKRSYLNYKEFVTLYLSSNPICGSIKEL